VGVDPAEAEGVHARAAGSLARPVDPRARLGVEVEDALREPQLGVRLLAVDGRRQHLVVEREHGLDQPRNAGRRHQVADHRLHRAQGAGGARTGAAAENAVEGVDLDRVAHGGRGAVRLDEAHARRVDAGRLVRPAQRQLLAFDPRREETEGLAVARHPDPLDDRVDAVPVALGVLAALQHHHPDPLAEQGPVGAAVEGPDRAAPRDGLELAEDHHDGRRGRGVHAAHHRDVTPSAQQVPHAEVDRDQRRRAGGIDDEVGAHEVEAVGDAARDDVGNEAGRGLGVEGGQARLELLLDLGQLLLGVLGMELPQDPQDGIDHDAVLDHGGVAAVHVGAAADDDFGPLAVDLALQVAGVDALRARTDALMKRPQPDATAIDWHRTLVLICRQFFLR